MLATAVPPSPNRSITLDPLARRAGVGDHLHVGRLRSASAWAMPTACAGFDVADAQQVFLRPCRCRSSRPAAAHPPAPSGSRSRPSHCPRRRDALCALRLAASTGPPRRSAHGLLPLATAGIATCLLVAGGHHRRLLSRIAFTSATSLGRRNDRRLRLISAPRSHLHHVHFIRGFGSALRARHSEPPPAAVSFQRLAPPMTRLRPDRLRCSLTTSFPRRRQPTPQGRTLW